MDDNAAGREQAHQVHQALEEAGIGLGRLWMHYFSIGGAAGEMEIDAFLHHSLTLPALQRELLTHAAEELIGDRRPPRIPRTSDLMDHDEPDRSEHDQHGAEDEGDTAET